MGERPAQVIGYKWKKFKCTFDFFESHRTVINYDEMNEIKSKKVYACIQDVQIERKRIDLMK